MKRAAALTAALGLCLLALASPADGRRAVIHSIQGELDRSGYTVIALAADGRERSARGGRFSVVPPARTVTLQIRDPKGVYLGPLVVGGTGNRVIMGVRAGARLGRIHIASDYARPVRTPPKKWLDASRTARAHAGIPIGAGVRGLVRSRASGPAGPGLDQDGDGIPGAFDIDDNGNLVLDVNEPGVLGKHVRKPPGTTVLPLSACPPMLCQGQLDVGTYSIGKLEAAFILAIVATVLAAASLLLQASNLQRRRQRRVEVEVRLGLPIYREGGGDWAVFVEVTNNTDQPVRWVSAALEMADGRRMYLMQYPPGGELPVVLQPHDSHQTWIACADLERSGLDLTEPVVAAAKLDSGEVLRSPQRRLLSRSLAERLHLSRRGR